MVPSSLKAVKTGALNYTLGLPVWISIRSSTRPASSKAEGLAGRSTPRNLGPPSASRCPMARKSTKAALTFGASSRVQREEPPDVQLALSHWGSKKLMKR